MVEFKGTKLVVCDINGEKSKSFVSATIVKCKCNDLSYHLVQTTFLRSVRSSCDVKQGKNSTFPLLLGICFLEIITMLPGIQDFYKNTC